MSFIDIEKCAWLAKLKLSEDEKKLFAKQLSDILSYFEKLREVNTEGVEPTSHVLEIANVFRRDEPRPSLSIEKSMLNVPRKKGAYVRAPKIL